MWPPFFMSAPFPQTPLPHLIGVARTFVINTEPMWDNTRHF